jgi:hypothetical protein
VEDVFGMAETLNGAIQHAVLCRQPWLQFLTGHHEKEWQKSEEIFHLSKTKIICAKIIS